MPRSSPEGRARDLLESVTSELASARTVADVADRVRARHASLGTTATMLYVRRGDQVTLAGYDGVDDALARAQAVLPLAAPIHVAEVARTGEPLTFGSYADVLARYASRPPDGPVFPSAQARVLLPLTLGADQVEGVLVLGYETLPDEERLADVRLIAGQITLALARARLAEEREAALDFERRLLAMVSHDLRTPLAAVAMAGALLPTDDPEVADLAARIERSAQRMAHIIDAVLSMGEAREAARLGARMEPTDVGALVEDLVGELRVAFPDRAFRAQVVVPAPVVIDRAPTEQILTNLLRNAHQHGAPDREVVLDVTWREARLHAAVENAGPAIAEEALPHLFEPYRRGATSRGMGLGLYIVRELTHAGGGTIHVESDAERTRFAVELPAPPAP